jgi:hypothetical protein
MPETVEKTAGGTGEQTAIEALKTPVDQRTTGARPSSLIR